VGEIGRGADSGGGARSRRASKSTKRWIYARRLAEIVIEPVRERKYKLGDLLRGSPRKISTRRLISVMAPDAGDVVWFPAPEGTALVLSPAAYNDLTGLMICCPLTTRSRTIL